MTNQARKIYTLSADTPDTHDVGTHLELVEVFADRGEAERVRDLLIGLPATQWWNGGIGWRVWHSCDFEIEEVIVR